MNALQIKCGILYCIYNSALGERSVKIGKTTNSIEERLLELTTTGVLGSFKVIAAYSVLDLDKAENLAHANFFSSRIQSNREFFDIADSVEMHKSLVSLLTLNDLLLRVLVAPSLATTVTASTGEASESTSVIGMVRSINGDRVNLAINPKFKDLMCGSWLKMQTAPTNFVICSVSSIMAGSVLSVSCVILGEIHGGVFSRGVSSPVTLNSKVYLLAQADKVSLLKQNDFSVKVGSCVGSDEYVRADISKLLSRHFCIVGSTGAGKSNTSVAIVKQLSENIGARLLIMDVHGEYKAALPQANNFVVLKKELSIPFWLLTFDELAWLLVDKKTVSDSQQDIFFKEFIFQQKRAWCEENEKELLQSLTVDTPVPFSLREVWYKLDRLDRATYEDNAKTLESLDHEGNAEKLEPAVFRPAALGSKSPFKGQWNGALTSYVAKIYAKLKDPKYSFLFNTGHTGKELFDFLKKILQASGPVITLDLSGLPLEVVDLVVGIIARLLFELAYWTRQHTGVTSPTLILCDEAHLYLPSSKTGEFLHGFSNKAVKRVMKEGRKYGLSIGLITQRPAEIDETMLSQCNSMFVLRLTNPEDRSRVMAALPDALGSYNGVLPSLLVGEAIVLGEAFTIPCRVKIELQEPRNKSVDPDFKAAWSDKQTLDIDALVTNWRMQNL